MGWGRAVLVVAFLGIAACGDDDGSSDSATTTVTAESTTTTAAPTTTAEATTTTADATTTTAVSSTTGGEAGLAPGDPCSLEEGVPDCIDPDGDGEGTYLLGGAECMAALASEPGLCEDLDGDGRAGYPDSG